MDFQTNIAKAERWGKYGMDKDTANEWLDKSIKGSKQNMKTGGEQYKKMFLDRDYAIEKGMVKRVSDKDKAARVGVAKELRKEASKRIKIRDD